MRKGQRKLVCPRGHAYTPENTWVGKTGKQACKACKRLRDGYTGERDKTFAERFWEKVDKAAGHGPQGECWLWTSSVDKEGYGKIGGGGQRGSTRRAHRAAYEITKGEIPVGLLLRHTCDTPQCVNPSHLVPGTQAQNIADMMSRGRHTQANATHCQRGHEFTPENTYKRTKQGNRTCRACLLAGARAKYRESHPPKADKYVLTGKTCKVCASTEPKVTFGYGSNTCRQCQYVTTKAKRGVWNKQKQQQATTPQAAAAEAAV